MADFNLRMHASVSKIDDLIEKWKANGTNDEDSGEETSIFGNGYSGESTDVEEVPPKDDSQNDESTDDSQNESDTWKPHGFFPDDRSNPPESDKPNYMF